MKKKNKKLWLILSIIVIIALFIGAFYNFFKNGDFNANFIVTDENGKKISNRLLVDGNSRKNYTLTFKKGSNEAVNYEFYYKINSSDINMSSLSVTSLDKVNVIKGSLNENDDEVVASIQIVNSSNEKTDLTLNVKYSNLEIEFDQDEKSILNNDFSICNVPNIIDGMIPVYYNESKKVWVKAPINNLNNNWYDYNIGKWANVVLVNTDLNSSVSGSMSRKDYMSADVGTPIIESDILAYYVWIPRYKYQLFNVEANTIDEQEINISFELKTDFKKNGSNNGEWLTHPAFSSGDQELSGIWVGKFETTGTNEIPTVKPNSIALTNQDVVNQVNTAFKFSTNLYLTDIGLNQINSHVMKNTEWGMVAYLSQSMYGVCDYGKCDSIRNNNVSTAANSNGSSVTGCSSIINGGNVVVSNTCDTNSSKPYNDIQYGSLASTTGSVYGIYDMNGGVWETTMGVIDKTNSFDVKKTLNSEYYDSYDENTDSDNYKNMILGDATGETNLWNDGYAEFITNSEPWFRRGGLYAHNFQSGIFSFGSVLGKSTIARGFRSIIVNIK